MRVVDGGFFGSRDVYAGCDGVAPRILTAAGLSIRSAWAAGALFGWLGGSAGVDGGFGFDFAFGVVRTSFSILLSDIVDFLERQVASAISSLTGEFGAAGWWRP